MKLLFLIFLNLYLLAPIIGQVQGKVHYTEVLSMEDAYKDMNDEFKKMMPKTQIFEKELIFNSSVSIYHDKKGMETVTDMISNDEGTFMIFMDNDEEEEFLYKDILNKTKTHQRDEEGKTFLVKDKYTKRKWKFTGEKIKYLGYECQKAVIETDTSFTVAWYTPQIPAFTGPQEYQGLPGLILMVSINDGDTEIKAQSIDLTTLDKKALKEPKKGKKVSEEELEVILKDYKAERKKMYKGNKFNKRRRH